MRLCVCERCDQHWWLKHSFLLRGGRPVCPNCGEDWDIWVQEPCRMDWEEAEKEMTKEELEKARKEALRVPILRLEI